MERLGERAGDRAGERMEDRPGGGGVPRPAELARAVAARLADGKRVRRALAGGGRLHVDRPLPFLCLWRSRRDDDGARQLVMTQPAYLAAAPGGTRERELRELVSAVARVSIERFGGFLELELREHEPPAEGDEARAAAGERPRPVFTIDESSAAPASTITVLEHELDSLRVPGCEPPRVLRGRIGGEGAGGIGADPANGDGRARIVIGVSPAWRSPGGVLYPVVLLRLAHELAPALSRVLFDYCRRHTRLDVPHFHALGRRAVVRAAWNVDRRLAEVGASFEFLRLCNPADLERTWREFEASGGERTPDFGYPPLPIDPEAIKRTLFGLPIEDVEDPTLSRLFREKQEELDRQITMLRDRGGRDFFYGSLQTYGDVEDTLHELARKLLVRLPSHRREEDRSGYVSAAEMAAAARAELAAYGADHPEFPSRVELADDIASGLLVSAGCLLVHSSSRFARSRVDALLQHEIGVHLLTWYNGRRQRLRLLAAGLPGYETLQEGLAVVAEYLAGGLSRPRLRMLAARVIACRGLCEGAGFVDTWRTLTGEYDYGPRTAFDVAVRVHRGGGLTKDACYLRGLARLLDQLGAGAEIEPLLVGKIAGRHLPVVEELRWRGLVSPPAARPRFLDRDDARARLQRLRAGLSPLDLIEPPEETP